MKALNYAKNLLVLITLLGVTSCDKYYDDEYLQNSDSKLCGYTWMVEWEEMEELYSHTLKYGSDGSGQEVFQVSRLENGKWKPYNTNIYHFSWKWMSDMEGLFMQYGPNDFSYFDNVWVRENYLSGTLDGEDILFYRADRY